MNDIGRRPASPRRRPSGPASAAAGDGCRQGVSSGTPCISVSIHATTTPARTSA
jgi:hypothetical protein